MSKGVHFTRLELVALDYHRNGISGVGFHAAIFIDHDNHNIKMLGILFDNPDECYCAVFGLTKLSKGDIVFGSNSWRGDNYEDMMRAWAEDYDNNQSKLYGGK